MTILPPMEQAAIKALADACNYSLHAHVPTEAVTRRVAKISEAKLNTH